MNVKGVFFCYKYAAMQLIKQGKGGRLIAAASVIGKIGVLELYSITFFAIYRLVSRLLLQATRGMQRTARRSLLFAV